MAYATFYITLKFDYKFFLTYYCNNRIREYPYLLNKMMRILIYLLFLVWMSIQSLSIFAQDVTQILGFHLTKGRKTSRIPIKVVNNLILIPIEVNKTYTLNFILDTGCHTPILLDHQLSYLFDDVQKRVVPVKGLGPNEAVDAEVVMNCSFDLPNITAHQMSLVILPENTFDVSSHLGTPVHGIIGYDLFNNFIIEIDYINEWIQFHHPKKKIKRKKFESFPLTFEATKPFIHAKIWLDDTESIEGNLMLDTGASYPLTLVQDTSHIQLPSPNLQAYLGTGLSGDLNGHIARSKGLTFSSFEFEDIITAFPDTTSVRHILSNSQRKGTIGGEILRRFRVVFDYPHQQLLLKKNSRYRAAFEYNKGGMLIQASGKDFKIFTIKNIDPNSPAAKSGLKKGDQILKINGMPHSQITLNEIYNMLNLTKSGRNVRFHILRGSKIFKMKMKMESSI